MLNKDKNNSVLLVGTGPMAIDYFRVLHELKINTIVVGRGILNCQEFQKETKHEAISGGVERWMEKVSDLPDTAIVAVTENNLGKVTIELLRKGIKNILVEKPGGLDFNDIKNVNEFAGKYNANVFVGYNRRFYSSTHKAKEIIQDDGGVKSFNFEFTEWGHIIKEYPKAEGVWEEWFIQNSSHVVDLAFFLGGYPQQMSCYTAGSLDWHERASIFAGSGITDSGALFSYHANWDAPGRWSVEMLTNNYRLIFRPMEKLQIQLKGSVAIEEVELKSDIASKFKPGLYGQTKDFLMNNGKQLLTIAEQTNNLKFYLQMINLDK